MYSHFAGRWCGTCHTIEGRVVKVYDGDTAHLLVGGEKSKIRLDADRRAKNREAASAAGVRLVEIIPSEDINGALGIAGTFDTSPETARRLIDLGRRDAEKILAAKGLWPKSEM